MRLRIAVVSLALSACATAGSKDPAYIGGGSLPVAGSMDPADKGPYALAGSYIFPTASTDAKGLHFGGLSGLAPLGDGAEMLAVSDEREDSRVYKVAIEWTPSGARVVQTGSIALQIGKGAPDVLDPEGIAITRNGHIIVSSEGVGNVEPRLPPALVEYDMDGRYVRQLAVRPKFIPNRTGRAVTGVRGNAAFESLTITSDFSRLYTAIELPLIQDGDADPFESKVRTRILEYVPLGETYRPAGEFVYEIEQLARAPFEHRFAINGLVELLALGNRELLVLERGFVESTDRLRTINRIQVFHVSLAGATNVSRYESLRHAGSVTPVKKTLLVDVNAVNGLDARLAGLDNFEGMAWGPAQAGGGPRPLVLVSDDNQNPRQVTAFLFLKRP